MEVTSTVVGVVAVTGTVEQPVVRIRPATSAQQAYAAALKGSAWFADRGFYELREIPVRFSRDAQRHGFALAIDPALGHDRTFGSLCLPYAALQDDGLSLRLYPRLGGKDAGLDAAGWAAEWKPRLGFAVMPVLDACRPGIEYGPGVREAYLKAMGRDPRNEPFAQLATGLAVAAHWPVNDDRSKLFHNFGRELFAYQGPGAVSAALGHALIADPPGVGKTTTSLAVVHLTRAERVIVVCPPVLVTNWQREVVAAGLDEFPVAIRASQTSPELSSRCVIVADSMLARPDVLARLSDWKPDIVIVDEAHRLKNRARQRSQAALQLAHHARRAIALTGTPVVSGPHELVPVLEFTGHLGPVFGGPSAFLERYCLRNKFKKLRPNPARLDELHSILLQHCMVRRPKDLVLPFLPARHLHETSLEVPVREYQAEVRDVVAALTARLAEAQKAGRLNAEVEELTASTGRFLAPLRKAAAMVKVPECVELVSELVEAGEAPVVVWAHHREPVDALVDGLAVRGIKAARLQGGTPDRVRQEVIDGFQAGTVPVLVASIHAAGVGLTLTRGNRSIFLEADWTPALVSQAIDRQHRIGQERPVLAQMLIAVGTLDEHVQRVLRDKERTAAAIHGDAADAVSVLSGDDLVTPRDLVEELVQLALRRLQARR